MKRLHDPIEIPKRDENGAVNIDCKWVNAQERRNLIELIKSTPTLAQSEHAAELIADHLLNNGVMLKTACDFVMRLSQNGSKAEVRFPPNELIGTVDMGGDTFPVYVGSIEAHQLGRLDMSDLGHRYKSASMLKRKITLIEV